MIKKNNITKFSEIISLLSSVLIGIISYSPYNKEHMVKVTNYINLSKSFNLINCGLGEYIHHFVSACLSILLIYGKDLKEKRDIDNYNITVQTNISTIFLILNYYYKNKIIKMLFIISFIYYRSKHFYHYFVDIHFPAGCRNICENHPLISDLYCYNILNISHLALCLLNSYWTILIFNKILGKDKLLLLLRNTSSLLLLLPVFYNQSNFNYYEISIIFLTISSLLYHINDNNNLLETRIFYYIDSFCIINSCLSRIINAKISIILALSTMFSWEIKKFVYISSFIFTFYDADITDKCYLLVSLTLNYIGFNNYMNICKWNILNSWAWHLGNSLYILIGGKYKKQLI